MFWFIMTDSFNFWCLIFLMRVKTISWLIMLRKILLWFIKLWSFMNFKMWLLMMVFALFTLFSVSLFAYLTMMAYLRLVDSKIMLLSSCMLRFLRLLVMFKRFIILLRVILRKPFCGLFNYLWSLWFHFDFWLLNLRVWLDVKKLFSLFLIVNSRGDLLVRLLLDWLLGLWSFLCL
jgi:hypothetical protein